MQKNRMSTMACLALVIGVLTVSIGTVVKLTTFALNAAPGNQTGGKMMSGNMTGTNTTSGMMHVQLCTSSYPCANSTNSTASK
jgi:hypothetical protein